MEMSSLVLEETVLEETVLEETKEAFVAAGALVALFGKWVVLPRKFLRE